MPRFSAGKPSAASQTVRSCESDSANMRQWSNEGGGCQPYPAKLAQISSNDHGGGKRRVIIAALRPAWPGRTDTERTGKNRTHNNRQVFVLVGRRIRGSHRKS